MKPEPIFGYTTGVIINYELSPMDDIRSYSVYFPNDSINLTKNLNFGISSRIAWNFRLSESWLVIPEYGFYLGLTDEFENIPSNTKSLRHYSLLGIGKKI